MTVRSLESIEFDKIIDCFLLAFQNYFVEMPDDSEYYRKRWSHAKVDLKFSFGMFDKDKLVGFIINGIDTRNEVLTAYNTGTGVIPDYRRKKIIQKIYSYAIPYLKSNGIKKCVLEVIADNTIAIKAYENIGFEITRTLHCYSGNLNVIKASKHLIEKDILQIDFSQLPNQKYYSWDHHKNSITTNPVYRFFQIGSEDKIDSYFIINDTIGYVAQFDVFESTKETWNDLFYGIQSISKKIKINNVDHSLQQKIEALNTVKINNTINQYQMEMTI